jgi:hypothetical protein
MIGSGQSLFGIILLANLAFLLAKMWANHNVLWLQLARQVATSGHKKTPFGVSYY